MNSLLNSLEYLRGRPFINSVRAKCLDLCYFLAMNNNETLPSELKALGVKGFKAVIKVYSAKEDIQKYFKNTMAIMTEQRKPLETISILAALMKIAQIKKGFFSLRPTSDIEERSLEGYNITEQIYVYLNTNIKEMEANTLINYYKDSFTFLENICNKMSIVTIDEKYFFMIWRLAFSSLSERMEIEFKNFIISNYASLLMNLNIFPYYFADNKIEIKYLSNRRYFKTFTYLFVSTNNAKRLVSILDNGVDFEIKEKVDILLGLNELWNMLMKIDNLNENNKLFMYFTVQVYRSFSLLSHPQFINNIYTNFINRFKFFMKSAIKQDKQQVVSNLMTLTTILFKRNQFKPSIKATKNDKANITIDVNSFLNREGINLSTSIFDFFIKYQQLTRISDNYEIWINNNLVSNVYLIERMKLSDISKNEEDKRLIKLKHNPQVSSLTQIAEEACLNLADSNEMFDIAEYIFKSNNNEDKEKLSMLLHIIPPIKKYNDYLHQELSDSAVCLKQCFSINNSLKFSYLLDITLSNLKNDSGENINSMHNNITKRQISNILLLLKELPVDENFIMNQIKLIKILNIAIKNNVDVKLSKQDRDPLIEKVTDMLIFVLSSNNIKPGTFKTLIHFIFIMKRLRYMNFKDLFLLLEKIENKPEAVEIAIEEASILNFYEEEFSDFIDYINLIKQNNKRSNMNILILKLVTLFFNGKQDLINEYVPFSFDIIVFDVLNLDDKYNMEWLQLKIKCLIDFLTVFDKINIDFYQKFSEWLDYFVLKTESRTTIDKDHFEIFYKKEFMEIVFSLILLLSLRGDTRFELVIKQLERFIQFQPKRGFLESDWMVKMEEDSSNEIKIFKGLKNLGCTCYISSIIQQLFMIPDFTNFILGLHISDRNTNIAKVN